MNKSEIIAQMHKVKETDCVDTANEYLVQLVKAEMDFADAESKVLQHFTQVSQDDLTEAYDNV